MVAIVATLIALPATATIIITTTSAKHLHTVSANLSAITVLPCLWIRPFAGAQATFDIDL